MDATIEQIKPETQVDHETLKSGLLSARGELIAVKRAVVKALGQIDAVLKN